MKLKSGKTLPYTLPPVLEKELDTRLQEFKKQFSGNIPHAKELMKIISDAKTSQWVYPMQYKIEEIYHDNELPNGTAPLRRAGGSLLHLLIGRDIFYGDNQIEPIYHDLIQTKINHFDLETPLIGNTEE